MGLKKLLQKHFRGCWEDYTAIFSIYLALNPCWSIQWLEMSFQQTHQVGNSELVRLPKEGQRDITGFPWIKHFKGKLVGPVEPEIDISAHRLLTMSREILVMLMKPHINHNSSLNVYGVLLAIQTRPQSGRQQLNTVESSLNIDLEGEMNCANSQLVAVNE